MKAFSEVDLDAEAIEADERRRTIDRAVAAYLWRLPVPQDTPLERRIARELPAAYCRVHLDLMRARVVR